MSKPTAQLTKMVTCSIINVGKSYRLDEINKRNFVKRMFTQKARMTPTKPRDTTELMPDTQIQVKRLKWFG